MSLKTDCLKCDGWGCTWCKDGPGEQGSTTDERELLRLRDRVRELETKRGAAETAALELWATLDGLSQRVASQEAWGSVRNILARHAAYGAKL